MKGYDKMNRGDMHMPMVESYQPKEREFAGMEGKTLNYVERRDKIQGEAAAMVRKQAYKGRYD